MQEIDGLVIAKALVYAIVTISKLPQENRDITEHDEMVRVLNLMIPDPVERERLAQAVEEKTGVLADLTDWGNQR